MLRAKSDNGWWLITHPDHAQLAADFASHWGNQTFCVPQPRSEILHGIRVHDDGWATRDARPSITRQGKPAAFSEELVGKYSAFEEIDLADYLAVRESALDRVEEESAYAALLVSMHTSNLLTERADRLTIPPGQLPLLHSFLDRQRARQNNLRRRVQTDAGFDERETTDAALLDGFHLLQAVDNLSLYSCIDYAHPGTLLHALPTSAGTARAIDVLPFGSRQYQLNPYPLDEDRLTFTVPARHVEGVVFPNSEALAEKYDASTIDALTITISR